MTGPMSEDSNLHESAGNRDDELRKHVGQLVGSRQVKRGDTVHVSIPLDELVDRFATYGIQERIDELQKLPNCTVESAYHGAVNVILLDCVITRYNELARLKMRGSDE